MHRFIASISFVFVFVVPALAADVTYDVRPGNGLSSPVQVAPGGTVPYEVTIEVSSGDNDGLLLFICDVVTDLGVDQSVDNSQFDPLIEQEFDFLPPSLGTPLGDDILDISASQNALNPGAATPGIGQGGAQVLVRGELVTPETEGTFSVMIWPTTTTQLIAVGGGGIINNPNTTFGSGFVIETTAVDSDGDNVADGDDNCPRHDNADQADCDGDEVGDVCELAQGQPVYRNAGASEGSVGARDPIAQDVHLGAGVALSAFEVTYTAQFSTALRLTVSFYENDAANALLPPDGLIAEFDYTFDTAAREEWFGATFDEPVAVGADLWFEVTLNDPSETVGVVELVTTTAAPTIGGSDGVLYKQADQSTDSGFLKFDLFADVDCNGNDLIDSCEVADGTSPDCDGNDVPDDCDPDGDGDDWIDHCDNCPETFNMSQRDADGDGVGDACDDTPGTGGGAGDDGGDGGDGDGSGQTPPEDGGSNDTGLGSLSDLGMFGGLMLGVGLMFLGAWFLGWTGFFMGLVMAIVLGLSSLLGGGAPPV